MILHKDYKEHESLRIDQAISNLLVAVICTILFGLTIMFTVPMDVASSGHIIDHTLRLQSITTGSPQIPLSQYTILADISWEGAIFGISLFLGQLLFLHKLAAAGKWTQKYDTFPKFAFGFLGTLFSGRKWNENVNSEKLSFLVMFILLATIDTVSGTLVRGWFGALGWGQLFGAFAFNIFFFTIMSEMFVFRCATWGLNAWANFIFVVLGFLSPALQKGFASWAHSSIDIGLPTAGPPRNNQHANDNNKSKNRQPHSNGGAQNHRQRKRDRGEIPPDLARMLEERD